MLFVIGLLVGVLIGAIAVSVYCMRYALKSCNMNWNEMCDAIDVITAAGNNRESTLVAYHDDVAIMHVDFHE